MQIDTTQSKSVAFRSCPEHAIIIKILRDGTFEKIYNGSGDLIWREFDGKKMPSNGQFSISLNKLKSLNELVSDGERIVSQI